MSELGRSAPPGAEGALLTVPDVLSFLRRHRRLLLAFAFGLGALALLQGLLARRTYTSLASFAPETNARTALPALSGLAGQLGIRLDAGGGPSPEFYAELLRSNELMSRLARQRYDAPGNGPARPLADLLGVGGETEAQRTSAAMKRLRSAISVRTDRPTGIVYLQVRAPAAELAQQLGSRLLEFLNRFYIDSRTARASAERQFVEQQVADAADSLLSAERALQRFLQANRQFNAYSAVQFQYDRLQRTVATRQQLYTSLRQLYDQARIDEFRNTPAIAVIDAPTLPLEPDSRRLLLRVLLAGMLGLALAVATGLLLDLRRRYLPAAPAPSPGLAPR